jgi:hypothetical protein
VGGKGRSARAGVDAAFGVARLRRRFPEAPRSSRSTFRGGGVGRMPGSWRLQIVTEPGEKELLREKALELPSGGPGAVEDRETGEGRRGKRVKGSRMHRDPPDRAPSLRRLVCRLRSPPEQPTRASYPRARPRRRPSGPTLPAPGRRPRLQPPPPPPASPASVPCKAWVDIDRRSRQRQASRRYRFRR